jgi:hypothetical protein
MRNEDTMREDPGTLRPRARVVGPGRRERAYVARIGELERRLGRADRELELAALVERGATRWLDRAERELDRTRAERSRLLVVLGALQRDNERLAERARALETRAAALEAPARAGFLARLLGRAAPRA